MRDVVLFQLLRLSDSGFASMQVRSTLWMRGWKPFCCRNHPLKARSRRMVTLRSAARRGQFSDTQRWSGAVPAASDGPLNLFVVGKPGRFPSGRPFTEVCFSFMTLCALAFRWHAREPHRTQSDIHFVGRRPFEYPGPAFERFAMMSEERNVTDLRHLAYGSSVFATSYKKQNGLVTRNR